MLPQSTVGALSAQRTTPRRSIWRPSSGVAALPHERCPPFASAAGLKCVHVLLQFDLLGFHCLFIRCACLNDFLNACLCICSGFVHVLHLSCINHLWNVCFSSTMGDHVRSKTSPINCFYHWFTHGLPSFCPSKICNLCYPIHFKRTQWCWSIPYVATCGIQTQPIFWLGMTYSSIQKATKIDRVKPSSTSHSNDVSIIFHDISITINWYSSIFNHKINYVQIYVSSYIHSMFTIFPWYTLGIFPPSASWTPLSPVPDVGLSQLLALLRDANSPT